MEIVRAHLNGDIEIQRDALYAMQNASHPTSDHKLHFTRSQCYQHSFEIIPHCQRNYILERKKLPRTSTSIFVRKKQSSASSGQQTTGPFTLKAVFKTSGMPARWQKCRRPR